MSLRTKTFIILLITLTCSLMLQSGISRLLLQSYEALEEEQMHNALKQIQKEFQSKVEFIHTITTGWVKWDNSSEEAGTSGSFIKTVLPTEALTDMRLHLFGFFNDSGQLTNLTLFDQEKQRREPSPQLISYLEEHPFLHSLKDQSQSHKGLILLPNGPMLLSSHPVVGKNDTSGARGWLVFGRVLDESELGRISEQLHLNLSIIRLDMGINPEIRDILLACRLTADHFCIRPISKERLAGYAVIEDISGHAALLISAEQDRSIYLQGLQTIRSFQWIILGTGLLFGLTFLLLLERQILLPIRQFTEAVSNIGAKGDPAEHIPGEGSIEFRKWSLAINRMLDSLARSQADLEAIKEQLELRVEERTAELEAAYNQLLHSEKLSCIGKMSASVAHEFGNPLFGIRNVLIHFQEKISLTEGDRQLLHLSLRECERLKNLIDRLKDFHRPSSNIYTSFDLHTALQDTLLLFEKEFNKKGIKIHRHYAQNLPEIPAVADQIKQVLLNLVKNAEEALPAEGGSIIITTKTSRTGGITLKIEDTGSGIAPENLPKIFEPFFSTQKAAEGTGLGLSISYMIVKKHRGDISVTSNPGQNTCFTVHLPGKELHGPNPV